MAMTHSRRVLHVVVAGEVGGAERMLCDLASAPGKSGAEHVVALMTPSDSLAETFARAGLDVRDRGRVREDPLSFLWRSWGPRDRAWLEGVLREERADIVQLHTFGSQVVGTRAALTCDLPVLRTEHSTRVYDDPSCWPFSKWSLRRADAVVFVSEFVEKVAADKFDRRRSARGKPPSWSVIRNGVDVDRFTEISSPRAAGPGHPFTFAMVARLDRRKGIDRALAALAGVPDSRLEVAGDGPERAALEREVERRGLRARVCFHGMLRDPRPLLESAHAALCSSRTEGLGIANLEAMAMGIPVVAVPVGGVPEIVHDGKTGWLARDESVEALTVVMRQAVAAPSEVRARGRAARRFVESHCSVDGMREAYGRVYERLARGSRG